MFCRIWQERKRRYSICLRKGGELRETSKNGFTYDTDYYDVRWKYQPVNTPTERIEITDKSLVSIRKYETVYDYKPGFLPWNISLPLEIAGYEERNITELSAGQKQRIAIARAVLKNPDILLVKELNDKIGSMFLMNNIS
ncbi:MAG: ATP-binding cassette domain-containing protein [Lachnospiraceae bacterium]|nr:ATP-binding cassette domain-containing protein [Lachnospiraceae bacterium]